MLTEGVLTILALLSVSAELHFKDSIPSLSCPLLMEKGN